MFILNPDPYLMPSIRISPFRTSDIGYNINLPDDNSIDDYLIERFKSKKYHYNWNGREALNIALSYYNLRKNDIVTILTTTGNFYISQCVTNEIDKFCKWSRNIEDDTKLILVNHEFGYPYKEMIKLQEMGIPIIEDCAHSFFSQNEDNTIGKIGDFVIYSFPKMFPMQIGGLLVSNFLDKMGELKKIEDIKLRYIKNILSHYINSAEEIINKRIYNYNSLKDKFESLGFVERLNLKSGDVPGVFMFRTNEQIVNLPELKKYYYSHGVQCSVFYGEESFFIPVHQNLNREYCDYIVKIMQEFLSQN